MREEYDNTIILEDEEGNECTFEILDFIELDDEYYVVLYPEEDEDAKTDAEGTEVIIRRIEDCKDENRFIFNCVENEELSEKLFEMFKERFWEKYSFID